MKKAILVTFLVTAGIFGTTLISCVKSHDSKITNQSTSQPVSKKIGLTKSTTELTPEVMKLGVSELVLESSNEKEYQFRIVAEPMMALNGIENYNLDKRVVRIVGDSENIYLVFEDGNRIGYNEKQNSYTFVTSSGIYEMSSPEFDHRFEAEVSAEDAAEFGWGMYIFAQIRENNVMHFRGGITDKSHGGPRRNVTHPCFVGVWSSRSVALANTQRDVNNFLHNNPNCHLVGGIDISCVWDDHFCFVTAQFECN